MRHAQSRAVARDASLAASRARPYPFSMRLYRPGRLAGVVGVLALILIALAILQGRWTAEVSQALRERMEINLHTAVARFRRDFNLQLLRICGAFQPPPGSLSPATLKFYADRYDDWMSASARPDLIAGLLVWQRDTDTLLRLDPAAERFTPSPWPPGLEGFRHAMAASERAAGTHAPFGPRGRNWLLDEQARVLFHPFVAAPPPAANSPAAAARSSGAVIIELNMDFIWQRLVPELIGRYFRGPKVSEYRVAVIGGDHPPTVFYESMPALHNQPPVTGDVVENLVGRVRDVVQRHAAAEERSAFPESGEAARNGTRMGALGARPAYLAVSNPGGSGAAWRLVVRHRSGSVEAAVANLRHRNLFVSFGILLLLAVSMTLIVVSAQRAQRLAALQMDFMAGVSHELRTPLAVICSAGENLADGVVGAPEQVKDYGALIRDEGRRLSEMVGQLLTFAANQAGRRAYQHLPLDMRTVVDAALAALQPSLDSARAVVEKQLDSDVPLVLGDPSALERCVRNLVSNAVKYGGASPWIGVRLRRTEAGEVLVAVADRGLGIDPEDLPHIFEPFYRGKNGSATQAHGTGLGLSLAKDIAEAMGGRVSVRTTRGQGSEFTLHLPAHEVASAPPQQGS
jgi:signal transduction histidine kinase